MFKKKPGVKTTIDSLIGATTRVEGNIVFHGGLRIDGYVRGDVVMAPDAPGLLVIGEHGRVEGNVVAAHLIVGGAVQGSVSVAGMVELQPKSQVSGEIRYRAIEIHRGAMVEATLSNFDGDRMRPGIRLAAVPSPRTPLVSSAS